MSERFRVCFLYRRSRLWRSKPFGGIRIGAPHPNRAKYIQLGGIPIGAPYPRGRAPSSVETFFYCIPLSQIIPPAKAQKKIQWVTFVAAQLSNPLAIKSHPALESVALASKLNKKLWRKRCRQLFSSNLTCAHLLRSSFRVGGDVREPLPNGKGKKLKVQYVTVLAFFETFI